MKYTCQFVYIVCVFLFGSALFVLAEDSKPQEKTSAVMTQEENDNLAFAFMQQQGARINVLEKLAQDKAGNADMTAADKAAEAFTAVLRITTKKHLACTEVRWDFPTRVLSCASREIPVLPAQPAAGQSKEPE